MKTEYQGSFWFEWNSRNAKSWLSKTSAQGPVASQDKRKRAGLDNSTDDPLARRLAEDRANGRVAYAVLGFLLLAFAALLLLALLDPMSRDLAL